MPEKPHQELLVALAGPAVNIIIAFLLFLIVPVRDYFSMDPEALEKVLYAPNLQTILFYLFIANVMLVVFNMIPAFPMDGGRVFRALLSIKMDRVKATHIAAILGQVMSVIFFIMGLFFNPFLILIAFFIFIGAYGENQMVKRESVLKGHKVKEAMLTNITPLHPKDSLNKVIDVVLSGTEKNFIVIENDKIVGILDQKDIIKHNHESTLLVKDIMQTTFKTVDVSEEIQEVIYLMGREKQRFFPVTENQKPVGAIDMENIGEFVLFRPKPATNYP